MNNPHWIKKDHLFSGMEYVRSCFGASFDEPWEQCTACGAKMTRIKDDPVFMDEAEILDILLGDEKVREPLSGNIEEKG